jgi:hypothetical protein
VYGRLNFSNVHRVLTLDASSRLYFSGPNCLHRYRKLYGKRPRAERAAIA